MADFADAIDLLILPGLGNSGPDHWQAHWCRHFMNATRVLQDDWESPQLADWLTRLDIAIANGTRPAVLVCHSLACALAAHWAARQQPARVVAALLVAPADVESAAHTPDCVRGFAPMPLPRFPVPALVVASSNDAFVTSARAQQWAHAWGADFQDAGALGHINSDSRLGLWPEGLALLTRLLARTAR